MRAVVRSALEPFMRARRALMQSAEALHGEDWLLVRLSCVCFFVEQSLFFSFSFFPTD
jgi:hypothetical protein